MFPITDIGYLPVPKELTADLPKQDKEISDKYYWKTPEFIRFHLQKLFLLFEVVIKRCITIEETVASITIERDSLPVHPRISSLPFISTKKQ